MSLKEPTIMTAIIATISSSMSSGTLLDPIIGPTMMIMMVLPVRR
jgi:hypothetical protein